MNCPLALALALLCFLPLALRAGQPGGAELDAAIAGGGFGPYSDKLAAWMNERVPARPSDCTAEALAALLAEPAFAGALAQRQLIAKLGAGPLADYARGGAENREFLGWLLRKPEAMALFLEGAAPVGIAPRREDKWTVGTGALAIWQRIHRADPEAREGILLKLAIATGLNPPGTGNRGAGQAAQPAAPLERYMHFKEAHAKGELYPSFDHLSVWEYRQIVSSNASNADLAWAREAINTWRPDLKARELVVNSTSEVWRRNSPIPFNDTFRNVLAGGGKCGPRSSWSIFVCQAFGIPAVGVRQPGHVCAAYKTSFPEVEPQPGNRWKVVYGRAWHVSKSGGLAGPDFLEEMRARSHVKAFSVGERLRWLASALNAADRAGAVMVVADAIAAKASAAGWGEPATRVDTSVPLKPEPLIKPRRDVVRIEAENFRSSAGAALHPCALGGKQVYNGKYAPGWGTPLRLEYAVPVPKTGRYTLSLRAAVVNVEQSVQISVDGGAPVTVDIPNSNGLWQSTPELELRLEEGARTITLSRPPSGRGLALRYLELKEK